MKLLTIAEESQQVTDERTLLDAVDNSASADTISHLLSSSISSQISDVFTTTNYVEVLGYHSKGDGGGGKYYYSSSTNRNLHNGTTIIDPTRTFPTDWTDDVQKTAWFTPGTGTGCWLRITEDAFISTGTIIVATTNEYNVTNNLNLERLVVASGIL